MLNKKQPLSHLDWLEAEAIHICVKSLANVESGTFIFWRQRFAMYFALGRKSFSPRPISLSADAH